MKDTPSQPSLVPMVRGADLAFVCPRWFRGVAIKSA